MGLEIDYFMLSGFNSTQKPSKLANVKNLTNKTQTEREYDLSRMVSVQLSVDVHYFISQDI